jgi:hypothetical protein
LSAPLSSITNWRPYVKITGRNIRTPYLYADHPGHPRPIVFDLRRADLDSLRKVAPEAIAEYESSIGRGA